MNVRTARLLVALAGSFWALSAFSSGEATLDASPRIITAIQFEGNEVTRPELLFQEMSVRVGDPSDEDAIRESRQAIMNLGLFTAVTSRLEPGEAGGETLVITVSEKRYVLPIPKIDRDVDGNIKLGVQLRLDNLQGLNQRLKINYQEEHVQDLPGRAEQLEGSFSYPRLLGSPYSFSTGFSHKQTPRFIDKKLSDSHYVSQENGFDIGTSRLLIREGPTWGWVGGVGALWAKETIQERVGDTQAAQDQRRVGIRLSVANSRVNDYLYSREGRDYGAGIELGIPAIGSQGTYTRTSVYWRYFRPFSPRSHTFLATQLRLGASSGYLFNSRHAYGVGGGNSIRGYDPDEFEGDSYFVSNIELHTPLVAKHPALGALAFVDVGNAFPDDAETRTRNVHSSVGVGLRWRIKVFVKIDLRLDYAQALDDGEYKILAGTKEAF